MKRWGLLAAAALLSIGRGAFATYPHDDFR